MALTFEWDNKKAESNLQKHKVSFEEAISVFGDSLSRTIHDLLHSMPREQRFVTIGISSKDRLLVVVHCDRGNNIRIISTRLATRREKRGYENE